MSHLHPELREQVKTLGSLLGQVIEQAQGSGLLEKIEEIRRRAKGARTSDEDRQSLVDYLQSLELSEIPSVTRAFNQFLNLANIAEQYHEVVRRPSLPQGYDIDLLFNSLCQRLIAEDYDPQALLSKIQNLSIELVLTAHPTEVTRRTLMRKYDDLFELLNHLPNLDKIDFKSNLIRQQAKELMTEIWHTNEIRGEKPSAVDEARSGFAVIENALWDAIPAFYRELDHWLCTKFGLCLPFTSNTIGFASWIGGDRDGNPNVTAAVTRRVLLLGRWMAADLYERDLKRLGARLSMTKASNRLLALAKTGSREPYRNLLHQLRERLKDTKAWVEASLVGKNSDYLQPLLKPEELLEPLMIMRSSLLETGMPDIANGLLLDTLRRAYCFGLTLARLDIRQESSRHTQVLSEISRYLGIHDYAQLEESQRIAWLTAELETKRPLFPKHWPCNTETQEVMATFEVIRDAPTGSIANYIISMAHQPSDVLAVALLLRATGGPELPIVPLFETLEDLQNADTTLAKLYQLPIYQDWIQGNQQVMIGYSDSAKDAGQMAAAWAQYQAQERLFQLSEQHQIKLTLFHGRGGTVGRGGGPAHGAILSQPPGTISGRFRTTEQGEMIRFKFGNKRQAIRTLKMYMSAVLEATLLPPSKPEQSWCTLMDIMSAQSVASYRAIVRELPEFIEYFKAVTPEQELGKLALGSRPARRRATEGIQDLRAIPWIFAWTQNRLMLPAWLGGDEALSTVAVDHFEQLKTMYQEWPFFKTQIDLMEMVVAKADATISNYYERRLAPNELQVLGSVLRLRLETMITLVNRIKNQDSLLAKVPQLRESMQVRSVYTDPLHYIQAELLARDRQPSDEIRTEVELALKVTMAGIAAGLRNTG